MGANAEKEWDRVKHYGANELGDVLRDTLAEVDDLAETVEALRAKVAAMEACIRAGDGDKVAALRKWMDRCEHTAEVLADVQPVDTEAPVREVVRGWFDGRRDAMCSPGGDPSSTYCKTRSALCFPHGWAAYEAGRSDSVQSGLSEEEARRWCLDGVLP